MPSAYAQIVPRVGTDIMSGNPMSYRNFGRAMMPYYSGGGLGYGGSGSGSGSIFGSATAGYGDYRYAGARFGGGRFGYGYGMGRGYGHYGARRGGGFKTYMDPRYGYGGGDLGGFRGPYGSRYSSGFGFGCGRSNSTFGRGCGRIAFTSSSSRGFGSGCRSRSRYGRRSVRFPSHRRRPLIDGYTRYEHTLDEYDDEDDCYDDHALRSQRLSLTPPGRLGGYSRGVARSRQLPLYTHPSRNLELHDRFRERSMYDIWEDEEDDFTDDDLESLYDFDDIREGTYADGFRHFY